MIAGETAPLFLHDVQREDVEISINLKLGDQQPLILAIRERRRDQRREAPALGERDWQTLPAGLQTLDAVVLLAQRLVRLRLK